MRLTAPSVVALASFCVALAAAGVAQGAGSQSTIEGSGQGTARSVFPCAQAGPSDGPASARVRFEELPAAGPTGLWRGNVAFVGLPCPAASAADCTAAGTVGSGLTMTCTPIAGSGSLGPVYVCHPGPEVEPPPASATGWAAFGYDDALASFAGTLSVTVSGPAAAGVVNLCD